MANTFAAPSNQPPDQHHVPANAAPSLHRPIHTPRPTPPQALRPHNNRDSSTFHRDSSYKTPTKTIDLCGMNKKEKIPIHRMDEKFSGIYISPLGEKKKAGPSYETSQPHRHDFYYCILLDKGQLELEVDFEKVQISERSIYLSYPGQIHQVNAARMKKGWFVAFDPSMIDQHIRDILDQSLSEVILLPLSAERSAAFFTFIEGLYKIYDDQTQLFRQTITQSMLTAFIYQVASVYLSKERFELIKHSARSIDITKNFRQLLRHNYTTMRRPADFASQMNISVSYLNDTVRSVTGFPVTWFIQQELMREAQRLLYHSKLTVKEIADMLGFEDPKYFNRLFSKVIGTSPGAFRKKAETAVHAAHL